MSPNPVYLHVTLQLVRGRSQLFMATMAELVPVIESYGWRLVGAFAPGIGRLGTVIDLWQVPSADAVGETLARVREHPDFPRWHRQLAECVAEEQLQLVSATGYSPHP